jgi:hypothetical protein
MLTQKWLPLGTPIGHRGIHWHVNFAAAHVANKERPTMLVAPTNVTKRPSAFLFRFWIDLLAFPLYRHRISVAAHVANKKSPAIPIAPTSIAKLSSAFLSRS